ncbi:T9SS type A sorting domain-containing protein [Flammeovirga aprica]|uniref:T9SS type A sorting domain-containing protein n=1 Tax=Flammeovirga aprica JL-4 TaxID=694437 RepID=A0A7X9RZV2_9BACT|nr:T9SS type A sorting domain-containing protein [Flammeovirga aprica]NME71768.1 T9SS type A sorting domain-containing protein [Flammeovirga aprica JL-4]
MKKIITTLLLIFGCWISVQAQQNVDNITVKCPPCRPVASCDQCFETQAQADATCNGSNGRSTTKGLVEELSSLSINIYPNPSTKGVFTVEGKTPLNGNIKLFSPVGALIKEFNVSEAKSFKVGQKLGLKTGIYILLYTDKSGILITKRVIVDHED